MNDENVYTPHAIELERDVLGGALLELDGALEISEMLSSDHFYKPAHQLIFKALMQVIYEAQVSDQKSVEQELRNRGELEEIGGAYYLTELLRSSSSTANIGYHARIIKEKFIQRKIIDLGLSTAENAKAPNADPYNLMEDLDQKLYKLSDETNYSGDSVKLQDTLSQAVEDLMNPLSGLKTGLDIDVVTNGFRPQNYIVAARPSMGKTAFVLKLAKTVSEQIPVGFMSLEMDNTTLSQRLICAEAGVPMHKAQSGRLTEIEQRKLIDASKRLYDNNNIIMNDTPALTPSMMRTMARKMKKKHGVGLIIVDYIQLGVGENDKEDIRIQIGKLSKMSVEIRKELQIPFISVAQLSREVEKRSDKRPQLSDLKETGDLEQDADMVMFLYRPEYYGISTFEDGQPTINTCEIIASKHRNGPTGVKRLYFYPPTMEFSNLAK